MHSKGFEPSTFGLGCHCSIQIELRVHNANADERVRTFVGTKPQES